MSEDRSNDKNIGKNSTSINGFQRPSDPIAQNDKDVDKPGNQIQEAEVSRCNEVPVLATRSAFLPDRSWGMNQQTQAAPSMTELLVSVLRFKFTILVIFLIVSAPLIAAIWTQIVPQYQARAEVRVRPIIPRLVFRTEDSGPIPFYDSFVNTQVSIMRSMTVLQRVLDQQKVRETQWYKNPNRSILDRLRGNPIPPMESLRDSLSVRPRPRTEIIDVSFIDPSANNAKLIVNTVLDQYIKYVAERSDATEDNLYRQLLDQYKSLENEIQGREKITAELRRSLGTEIPQELISSMRIRLDDTQVRLNEMQQKIAVLEWDRNGLEDLMRQSITDDNGNMPVSATDEMGKQRLYNLDAIWLQRDENVRILEHQLNISLLTPNHPDSIQMGKNLEFAQELLRLREAQLDEQWRSQPRDAAGVPTTITGTGVPSYEEQLRSLEYQLARSKQEEKLLRTEFDKQEAEFEGLFESAQLLDKQNNALQHTRELFSAVQQRLDQKNMERNVPGSIEVLMQAYSPSRPNQDRRMVFTAMVLCLGLGIGSGVAFLRASRNQAVYTPKDIPHPVNVPFLGYIPLIRTKKSPGRSLRDEIEKNQFLLLESTRVLRTALLSRLNGQTSTTILITSAMAGTGKSSITKILGQSMAQVGKRVLMIDVDFHKMTLSKWFGFSDRLGFMDSMRCKLVQKRHIYPTETSGLSIMPAGKRSDDGVVFEEFANGAFKACMNQLSRQYNYDIILLDSSPILPVADSTILAGQVDGIIMVERENISHRMNIFNALTRLDSSGGNLFGTVFIGSGGQKDYGYNYRYDKAGKS